MSRMMLLYHKGTKFLANHNISLFIVHFYLMLLYHKGTKFLANHNSIFIRLAPYRDVIVPQRYKIFSKSQHSTMLR